jgi:hypothetical protein
LRKVDTINKKLYQRFGAFHPLRQFCLHRFSGEKATAGLSKGMVLIFFVKEMT